MPNTITVAAGTRTVTGDLTMFVAAEGDLFVAGGGVGAIERRDSNTQITLSEVWAGPTLTNAPGWTILPLGPSWQSTTKISKAVSDLIRRWDAASPFRFDAYGTLAERALYNDQGKDFVFLEIEDFRARLYIKLTNDVSAASWSAPVIIGTGGQVDFENALARVVQDRDAADAGIRQDVNTLRTAQQNGDAQLNADLAYALTGVRSEIAAGDAALAALQNSLATAVAENKMTLDAAVSTLASFSNTLNQTANNRFVNGRVTPEEFGANPDDQNFNNSPAINAMLANQRQTGRLPTLAYGKTYACADTINFDPSRNGLDGNSSTLSFHLKTFTDPATQAELVRNGSFDNDSEWIASTSTTLAPFYDGALNFTPPEGEQRFLEIGQLISAPAGSTLRVTLDVRFIESHTVGINTYRDVSIGFRRNTGNPNNSIVGGGQIGGSTWVFTNREFAYKPGAVVTHDFNLSESNPYLRVQTSAKVKINAISVKIIPNNVCLKLTVPPAAEGGLLRGHNIRDVRNLGIRGKPGTPEAVHVIATQWDTPVYTTPPNTDLGQHSRAGFYNVNISDGVGVAFDFRNRTYLSNFFNIRATAAVACVRTMPGAHDSGENIVFVGGNIGGGLCGVDNEGGFEIHMISTSIDFSRQWYKGQGGFSMIAGHLETNQPVDPNAPLIDVYGGHCHIQAKLQVNGSTDLADTTLAYPFRVGLGGFLNIETETPYNLQGTSGALCQGEGRIRFVARGGTTRAISSILKRDDVHNIFGAASRFDGAEPGFLCWTQSSSPGLIQATRYAIDQITEGAFTGDFARSDLISNVNGGGTNTLTIGREIIMDGVFPGTTIIANPTATSAQMSSKFNKAPGTYSTGKWRLAARTRTGMELSAAQKRNGSKSLRLYRGLGGINQIHYIAFPIEAHHAAGFEMFWKIPPNGIPGSSTSIFFQGFFARLNTPPGALVPTILATQFITDQPQVGVNRETGVDWTRMTFNTHRVDPAGSEHDSYMPPGMTHVLVAINLSSTPGGFEMFIADPCASQF
ncbi:hypothetical protein CLBKND_04922 [Methylorubrum aminovorans]